MQQTEVSPEQIARSRRTLVTIFLVCAAPLVAALLAFYVWHPERQAMSGKLIDPPLALQLGSEMQLSGAPLAPALKGMWVMALRAPAACDEACRQTLYTMRQVRIATAGDMDRVARLWVLDDAGTPAADLLTQHAGLLLSRDATLAAALGEAGHIVVIDPRGNLMMRFAAAPEPKGILKDLQKLLKYSR